MSNPWPMPDPRFESPHFDILSWLEDELTYADSKWPIDAHDALMTESGIDGKFGDDIQMYLHRASVLGMNNPLGLQALGKACTTIIHAIESAQRVFDTTLPPGGIPSGSA